MLGMLQTAHGQEFIKIRKISLSKGDTTVVAGILADVKIDHVNPGVFYHWYANGQVFSNQGGYAGNLLHGEYVEYGPDGGLLLKGSYDRGLQSGQWTYWYSNGATKEILHYESGHLEGKMTRFGPAGRIYYSANFKKGQLHGEMTTVVNDTLFQVKYKSGIEKKRIPLHVFENSK